MINTVEIQTNDTKYEVEYTWDHGEDASVVIGQDQTRFSFKYKNGELVECNLPDGYGVNLMNDIIQRIYDIEIAKSRYSDELKYYCYIRRI